MIRPVFVERHNRFDFDWLLAQAGIAHEGIKFRTDVQPVSTVIDELTETIDS